MAAGILVVWARLQDTACFEIGWKLSERLNVNKMKICAMQHGQGVVAYGKNELASCQDL